jgi:hypothetical protein
MAEISNESLSVLAYERQLDCLVLPFDCLIVGEHKSRVLSEVTVAADDTALKADVMTEQVRHWKHKMVACSICIHVQEIGTIWTFISVYTFSFDHPYQLNY